MVDLVQQLMAIMAVVVAVAVVLFWFNGKE
jgi:hypothetical protein